MLAETIDAYLLRTAAKRKNDEWILVQIWGKDCVPLEVRYHKVCYCNSTKFLTRETKDQSESERPVSVYDKSYDVFCKEVIDGGHCRYENNVHERHTGEICYHC